MTKHAAPSPSYPWYAERDADMCLTATIKIPGLSITGYGPHFSFWNVHKQPFKLKHSFCLILKNKTKKSKESQSSCLSFFFSETLACRWSLLKVFSSLTPEWEKLLCCKNQECRCYNEAALWKDRTGENWINVNMAISLPPSRRNMANLSRSCYRC